MPEIEETVLEMAARYERDLKSASAASEPPNSGSSFQGFLDAMSAAAAATPSAPVKAILSKLVLNVG